VSARVGGVVYAWIGCEPGKLKVGEGVGGLGRGLGKVWGGEGRGVTRPNMNGLSPVLAPSTSLSAATPRELLACPVSQRAIREVPAAWSCCWSQMMMLLESDSLIADELFIADQPAMSFS
jgi:hypothetical protein